MQGQRNKSPRKFAAAGGKAVSNSESVTEMAAVQGMIEQAKRRIRRAAFHYQSGGHLARWHVSHKMSEDDWKSVIDVHSAWQLQCHARGDRNVPRAGRRQLRSLHLYVWSHRKYRAGELCRCEDGHRRALSRIIAMEGARKNVRSNIIAPFAWTRMLESIPVTDEASALSVWNA